MVWWTYEFSCYSISNISLKKNIWFICSFGLFDIAACPAIYD